MNTQYLALLRGINVGGKNIIKMADLKTCFEDMGFSEVQTYIQSGNVLFKSDTKDRKKLSEQIEKTLSKKFSYKSLVVLVSHDELKEAIKGAPAYFNNESDKYRCDVIFLKEPLTPKEAIKVVSTREGVDQAHKGKNVFYFSRLASQLTKSRLSKITQLPVYQKMTIRNWNTTTKLLSLMEEMG